MPLRRKKQINQSIIRICKGCANHRAQGVRGGGGKWQLLFRLFRNPWGSRKINKLNSFECIIFVKLIKFSGLSKFFLPTYLFHLSNNITYHIFRTCIFVLNMPHSNRYFDTNTVRYSGYLYIYKIRHYIE